MNIKGKISYECYLPSDTLISYEGVGSKLFILGEHGIYSYQLKKDEKTCESTLNFLTQKAAKKYSLRDFNIENGLYTSIKVCGDLLILSGKKLSQKIFAFKLQGKPDFEH